MLDSINSAYLEDASQRHGHADDGSVPTVPRWPNLHLDLRTRAGLPVALQLIDSCAGA